MIYPSGNIQKAVKRTEQRKRSKQWGYCVDRNEYGFELRNEIRPQATSEYYDSSAERNDANSGRSKPSYSIAVLDE